MGKNGGVSICEPRAHYMHCHRKNVKNLLASFELSSHTHTRTRRCEIVTQQFTLFAIIIFGVFSSSMCAQYGLGVVRSVLISHTSDHAAIHMAKKSKSIHFIGRKYCRIPKYVQYYKLFESM